MSGGSFDPEKDLLSDALRAGAAAFLRKPFRVEDLLGLVGEVLGRSVPQEP
jgi:hypothetical protein